MQNIVAGAKGLVLTLDPQVLQPGNLTTLSGMTMQFSVMNQNGQITATRTATNASDNKTATYTTDGTEFPVGGRYQVRLTANQGSGFSLPSPWVAIAVLP